MKNEGRSWRFCTVIAISAHRVGTNDNYLSQGVKVKEEMGVNPERRGGEGAERAVQE